MQAGRLRRSTALILGALLLCACTAAPAESTAVSAASQPGTATGQTAPAATEDLLHQMTLRQKVGQLFVVRPDALELSLPQNEIDDDKANGVKQMTDSIRRAMEEYPVGGICQFGKNIETPQQITDFNAELQAGSEIPLFLAVDEEGGNVARLANHPAFDLPVYESAAAVGASGNAEPAGEMGQTIGAYLKDYGFNMDFAPMADVWTNPENTVIGTRAFSQDAGTAARMAGAMAQGLQAEGILPTFKHFPGHGDTAEDSHSGLAHTDRTLEEMRQCEFLPFVQAKGKNPGPRAVMVGHIVAPALGTGETPASLSRAAVTDLLRCDLLAGEDILVITDSLAMGAITAHYSAGEAAVAAFLAGNDLLLMPDGLQEAFEAVLAAVQDGKISEHRLDESVARILRFKQQYAGLEAAAEK